MECNKLVRENSIYTSCYCEENVWKLCESLRDSYKMDLSQFFIVFISNNNKEIPLWCQKAASNPSAYVVWDYHVILIDKKETKSLVYDLDTTLDFPCQLQEYADKALRSEQDFNKQFFRMFRVIPASSYLATFASDRSHMRTTDGKWLKPPPSYLPIRTQDSSMNLFDYVEMDPQKGQGTVMDLNNFLKHFECQVE